MLPRTGANRSRHLVKTAGPSVSFIRRACVLLAHCVLRVAYKMVGPGGLEPPTLRLSSACSNQLSYEPELGIRQFYIISRGPLAASDGGADRTRTGDVLLAKQVLYQLSYDPIGRRFVCIKNIMNSDGFYFRQNGQNWNEINRMKTVILFILFVILFILSKMSL